MAAVSWGVFGLLAALWTGGAWIAAVAAGWLAGAMASGTASQAARDVAALPLPGWLQLVIDPAWLAALQGALRWLMDAAASGLPFAATLTSWLVPAIWIGWGLGLAVLLAGAVGTHLLVRRFRPRRAA